MEKTEKNVSQIKEKKTRNMPRRKPTIGNKKENKKIESNNNIAKSNNKETKGNKKQKQKENLQ